MWREGETLPSDTDRSTPAAGAALAPVSAPPPAAPRLSWPVRPHRFCQAAARASTNAGAVRALSCPGSQVFMVRTLIASLFDTDPGGSSRRGSLYL